MGCCFLGDDSVTDSAAEDAGREPALPRGTSQAREEAPIPNETNGATVEVELRPVSAPAFAAVVRLCGEHDLATGDDLRTALAPVHGSVLVDLSECSFVDSTVIGVLVADHQSRIREGHRLELLVPAENTHVTRTLNVSGVGRLLPLHASLPPADPGGIVS